MGKKNFKIERTPSNVRLFRERNGWCVYSARLWLALEVKGISYDTILIESRGDTYDSGESSFASGDSISCIDGRPDFLDGSWSLPMLQFPNDMRLHNASTEDSSLQLLQELDLRFPGSAPLFDIGDPRKKDEIIAMSKAFGESVPSSARVSPRAAWLFCEDEGYRLDPLPRSTFEQFLDEAETLLSKNDEGPFFCGSCISAADVVWAPLLERYAIQLPCLHTNLLPKDPKSRPNLYDFYRAMDKIPAYACRVKGDAASWRKVLYVDPWWPRADVWHPRETVGIKGELLLSEEECCYSFGATTTDVEEAQLWLEYAKSRPHVSPNGPGAESAIALIRNRSSLTKDAVRWGEEQGCSLDFSLEDLDGGFRAIAWILSEGGNKDSLFALDGSNPHDKILIRVVSFGLLYLDDRLCVPRDLGAQSAAALRQLRKDFVNTFGDVV